MLTRFEVGAIHGIVMETRLIVKIQSQHISIRLTGITVTVFRKTKGRDSGSGRASALGDNQGIECALLPKGQAEKSTCLPIC